MTPLDRLIANPRLVEVDHVDVAANADMVWPAVRHGDLARSPIISALFHVRTLASRPKTKEPMPPAIRIDDLRSSAAQPGFQILVDEPAEFAVGAIGKVWHLDIPFVHVNDADEFDRFSDAGWVKVAWAMRVLPAVTHGTRIEIEVRVSATDEESWRKFRRYFRLIGPWSRFIRRSALRALGREFGAAFPHDDWRDILQGISGAAAVAGALLTPFQRKRRSHWGTREEVARRRFPGDDLIAEPRWGWTHAIDIDAPAGKVWPWIAQIGADRGGFYSYQWLENVAGCHLRNAEAVHPEWELREGQELVVHPDMPPLRVAAVGRGRYFVAHAPADSTAVAEGRPWVAVSWLFLLEPLGPSRCRFVSRYRAASSDDLSTRLSFGPTLVEPISFVMDRRMLVGVKERAERPGAARVA